MMMIATITQTVGFPSLKGCEQKKHSDELSVVMHNSFIEICFVCWNVESFLFEDYSKWERFDYRYKLLIWRVPGCDYVRDSANGTNLALEQSLEGPGMLLFDRFLCPHKSSEFNDSQAIKTSFSCLIVVT